MERKDLKQYPNAEIVDDIDEFKPPKYDFQDKSVDIDKPLYGIYECSKVQPLTELYVCESQINALTCWVYGKPAVALFGTGNQKQMQALKNVNCRKLIIALDPDASGEKGVKRIVKNVRNKILYKAQVPIGKDINDLSYQEFLNLNLIELF